MIILDRLFGSRETNVRTEPQLAIPARQARRRTRRFDGANVGRLDASWLFTNASGNAELRGSLARLRGRSRDLAQNNPYVKRFLNMVGDNVVGASGIQLQARVLRRDGTPDVEANVAIERAWQDWGRVGSCTVCRRWSWRDAQRLAIQAIARDGEFLLRKVPGRQAGNRAQFGLQLLEADYLADDKTVEGGDADVFMGVEVDEFGGPVAFWLNRYHPGEYAFMHATSSQAMQRTPADRVLHLFVPDRPSAYRGVPWVHASMIGLRRQGSYEEAELVAAITAASQMGALESPDGDPGALQDEDDEGGDVDPMIDVEAGTIRALPPGMKLSMFKPEHPNGNFAEFSSAILRGVASGLGVSFPTLANDLRGVSYSSIRQGALEDRDFWRQLQAYVIEHCHELVYRDWLESALMFGAIPGYSIVDLDRLSAHAWQARGWQWVDPAKEVAAAKESVALRIRSRTSIMAEQGRDFGDTIRELAAEQRIAEAEGVKLETVAPAAPMAAAPDEDADEDDGEDNGDKPDDGEDLDEDEAEGKADA